MRYFDRTSFRRAVAACLKVLAVVCLSLWGNGVSARAELADNILSITTMPGVESLAAAQDWSSSNHAEEGVGRWLKIDIPDRVDTQLSPYYLSIPRGAMRSFRVYQPPEYAAQEYHFLRTQVDDPSTLNSHALRLQNPSPSAPVYLEVLDGDLPGMVHLYSEAQFLRVGAFAEYATLTMRALMLFTVLFALFLWVKLKSSMFIAYGAFIFFSFLLYFSYLDGWAYHFPELGLSLRELPMWYSVIGSLCYFFALIFVPAYLQYPLYLPKVGGWVRASRWGLSLVVLGLVVSQGHPQLVLLANLFWLLVAFFIWLTALLAWRAGSRFAIYILLGWTPFIVAAMDMLAIAAQWKSGSDINLILFDCAVIFELIVFQLGLADMVLSFRQERDSAVQLAFRDALSGAYNRHGFQKIIVERLKQARTQKRSLAVALLDIDLFKRVNDQYGHDVGDVCIREVAQAIQAQLRAADLLVRYGGEEFLLVLTGVSLKEAEEICERVRRSIHSVSVPVAEGSVGVTVSLGLAQVELSQAIEMSIKKADKALYNSKDSGRDCLTVAQ